MYTPARVLVMLLLLIGACGGPSNDVDQEARYHAMIGRSGKELVQAFGPPTRRENIAGHDFLTYEGSDGVDAPSTASVCQSGGVDNTT